MLFSEVVGGVGENIFTRQLEHGVSRTLLAGEIRMDHAFSE